MVWVWGSGGGVEEGLWGVGGVQPGLSLLNLSSSIFPYPHPFPSSLVESPPTLGIRLSLWVPLPTIHPKYAFGYIRLYYVTLSRYTALYRWLFWSNSWCGGFVLCCFGNGGN